MIPATAFAASCSKPAKVPRYRPTLETGAAVRSPRRCVPWIVSGLDHRHCKSGFAHLVQGKFDQRCGGTVDAQDRLPKCKPRPSGLRGGCGCRQIPRLCRGPPQQRRCHSRLPRTFRYQPFVERPTPLDRRLDRRMTGPQAAVSRTRAPKPSCSGQRSVTCQTVRRGGSAFGVLLKEVANTEQF